MIAIVPHRSGADLYSATAVIFLGTEQVFPYHSSLAIERKFPTFSTSYSSSPAPPLHQHMWKNR
jgi:hypothetical protein